MQTDYFSDLQNALKRHSLDEIRELTSNRPPTTIAGIIRKLAPDDQVIVFRVLPRAVAAAAFENLAVQEQEQLLRTMAHEQVVAILTDMAPDDRTALFDELPATATKQLLSLLSPADRSIAVKLLGYPEKTVGRLMTPNYVAIREAWSVRETLDFVRLHGENSETLSYLYVVDDEGKLIDDLPIRAILLAEPEKTIKALMDNHFVALSATEPERSAIKLFRDEDRKALPVLDTTGVLIGIVTIDDVLAVTEKMATSEIQKIGGLNALDAPYMQVGFWHMVRKRASWLVLLFLGEMLTATAMGFFEDEIAKAVVLALFLPLIISSGGNSGSQATTLVIRAMALREIELKDWWRIMRREVFSGLALGAILAIVGFLRITLWAAFGSTYGPHWFLVATTVSASLVCIVMWGSVAGAMLPLLLKRLGIDPATASAPFVATLVDVTGLVIYFTVGMVILRGTLL